MSFLLHIINGEAVNLNIKLNERIVGYPNQKETLKLSQYADDTIFFVISEDSVVEILNFFKQYELATDATIIIFKRKITLLANAKIYNLNQKIQNIQIKETTEFVKILGIYFTNNLQETSNYNWNKCILEIEKQIHQLSARQLSLRGKSVLLNTMTLSKAAFLSNNFTIPKPIQQQLETYLQTYLAILSKITNS